MLWWERGLQDIHRSPQEDLNGLPLSLSCRCHSPRRRCLERSFVQVQRTHLCHRNCPVGHCGKQRGSDWERCKTPLFPLGFCCFWLLKFIQVKCGRLYIFTGHFHYTFSADAVVVFFFSNTGIALPALCLLFYRANEAPAFNIKVTRMCNSGSKYLLPLECSCNPM